MTGTNATTGAVRLGRKRQRQLLGKEEAVVKVYCRVLLVCCNSSGFTMIHLFQDLVDALGPDERLGVFVVGLNVMLDGFDEFFDALEGSAANPFASDLTEPALD